MIHNSLFILGSTTKLVLSAKDMAHRITNLCKGGIRLDGVDDQRHEIFSARCSSLQRGESVLHPLIVAPLAQGCQLCHLPPAYFGVNAQQLRSLLGFQRKAIDAYNNSSLFFQAALIVIRRLLDLRLHETAFDSVHAASQGVDLAYVIPGSLL